MLLNPIHYITSCRAVACPCRKHSIFINLIPYVGSLIDFIFMLLKSAPDNEWGPNPFNEQKETTIESEVVAKQEENKNVIDVEL